MIEKDYGLWLDIVMVIQLYIYFPVFPFPFLKWPKQFFECIQMIITMVMEVPEVTFG